MCREGDLCKQKQHLPAEFLHYRQNIPLENQTQEIKALCAPHISEHMSMGLS